jgi:hypothetical protein
MALNPAKLQAGILKVCLDMNGIKDDSGNHFMAEGFAKAIVDYIAGGQTSTQDSGAAPAGIYTGAGVGAMAIAETDLADAFASTFEAVFENDALAEHIAGDIDDILSADDIVSETSTGTVTTPSGVTSPFAGPAVGSFSGNKNGITTILKACFSAMNRMSEGGNEKFALDFATAIHLYMTSGSINVELQAPFAGTGSGVIA